MAKWGEGDPRWIVEERADGTNVNNWHWTAKNATGWSKGELNKLLTGIEVSKGPIVIKFEEIKSIEGEASANNRKAKLIFLYEWVVKVSFVARVAGFESEYKGCIEIPNLSDENDADEIDVQTTIETRGPHEAEIRSIMSREGTKLIQDQCGKYIKNLKEEFSKGLILPTNSVKPQVISSGKTTIVDKKSFQNTIVESKSEVKEEKPAGPVNTTTFETKYSFKVSPDVLFKLVFEKDNVAKWSNSQPKVYLFEEGGEFSLMGGQISGKFVNIVENKEVKLKWRLKSYPVGHFADVSIMIDDQRDSSDLIIKAESVPKNNFEDTKIGFERYYCQFLGRTFMCALTLE
ncbi:Activator of 90 kDa heat shock protein ATPase homolog 1 [Strongyloides ratti]|uniref:Activator of 90 kDa heat shock protein ATPase homolog 1 n=1 Tax=Strongyloides ratti TaxID=34506 RepID=A0A090N0B1_STRRB|nr:Activator of 90 kDa heat shock protein ATPase homolog 1 [Strongyloides ratti]CEF70377.1 Activator of 90 kDa heat shock protein ATPase homolog 1 [Strongyloides ratti]